MYILCGMSFAGKSVLAREIQKATGYSLIDPDEVSREWGLGLKGEFVSEKDWADIHKESEKRAIKLLKEGNNLIYDTTALGKKERDHLRDIANSLNVEPIVIVVNIDRKTAYKRWQENNKTKERYAVHLDDFNMCADAYAIPGDDEEFVVFNEGDDMNKWIEKYID